jgi:hypothetical protein
MSAAETKARELAEDAKTNLETWCYIPRLQAHTMPTSLVLLTLHELRALSRVGELLDFEDTTTVEIELAIDQAASDGRKVKGAVPLDEDGFENASLQQCVGILSRVVKHVHQEMDGKSSFAKMSTRSAKDCVYDDLNEKVVQLWRTLFDEAKTKPVLMPLEQLVLNTFIAAASLAFEVRSVGLVFAMFARSSRIMFDINRVVDVMTHEQSAGAATTNFDAADLLHTNSITFGIILRRWQPIPPEAEFRVWVKDGRITAVSQYYFRCYYPDIARRAARGELHRAIQVFFDSVVSPCLPPHEPAGRQQHTAPGREGRLLTRDFVLDLAVDFDRGAKAAGAAPGLSAAEAGVSIIELNPFLPTTSRPAFSTGPAGYRTSWKAADRLRCR